MKKTIKIGYPILLLLFIFSGAWAQTASIEGVIVDKKEQAPLEFSTISVYRSTDSSLVTGVLSSAKGKFTLEKLPAGTYYLVVQFLGYQTKRIAAITLANDQRRQLGLIELSVSQNVLREIQVSGQKAAVYHQIDRQVYRAGQFQSAVGGTAIDVLKNLPSVSVDAQGGISIRGSSGFLVLLNGKPVQGDPVVLLSQLPANGIDNVEVITTPSAKYDADGKAGIINIITKTGVDDGVSLIVNGLGGLPSVNDFGNQENPHRYGADATLTYKKGKWDISVGANYNRNDVAGRREGDANTTLGNQFTSFPSIGERSTTKENYAARATVGYNPTKNDVLRVGLYNGTRTDFRTADLNYVSTRTNLTTGQVIRQLAYYNANLVKKQGTFFIGNAEYVHTFTNKSSLSVSGLYERDQLSGFTKNLNVRKQESTDTLQYTLNTNERPLTGYRLKVDYLLNLGKGKLESGYQYRYLQDQGNFVYLQKDRSYEPLLYYPAFSGDVLVKNVIHAVYSQYASTIGKKLSYTAGLRYEVSTRQLTISSATQPYQLNLNNLFPSASVVYQISEDWQAKAGYSRRVQRTTSLELNPLPEREHSETLEQGDPTLLPEFISLSEAGFVRNWKKGSLFATVYYQGITNAVNRVNSVYADSILNRIYTNAGNARRIGVEVGLDLKPTNWWKLYVGGNVYDYKIKGSLFNNTVTVNNASLVYSVNVNTSFQLSKTLNLQWNLNYLSLRATAQGQDSRFFTPNASLKKTFLDGRLSAMFQWQSMDMGFLRSNEQRITTFGRDFYTTTNYIYEKDVLLISVSYNLNQRSKKVKFTESEFGEKEF